MRWIALLLVLVALLAGRDAHAQGLGGFLSPGPLAEPHADLEGVTQCIQCHEPGKGVSAARCLACHDEVDEQVRSKKGFHADKGQSCQDCHHDHRGRTYEMVKLVEDAFDHDETGFPLEGSHAKAECTDCHETPKQYGGLDPTCSGCHDDPHGAEQSERPLLATCESCHGATDWEVASIPKLVFDHTNPAHVDWVLEGAHKEVGCAECHADAVFLPTPHEACTDCHEDPHRAPFSNDCATCHKVSSWKVPNFDHLRTGFALEGEHRDVSCRSCHGGRTTKPLKHDRCQDCHADPHSAQFVPRDCESCHTVDQAAFRIAAFDHTKTHWPLRGKHQEVACAECHGEGRAAKYVGLDAVDCDSCHQDPHAARFEPTPCVRCHDESGWAVSDFDHGRTDFPLTGAHTSVTCETCHADGKWSGIPHESCASCHSSENPHGAAFADDTCATCHTTADWASVAFAHDVQTSFPLGTRHDGLACLDCHEGLGRFAGLGSECVACHLDDKPRMHFDDDCATCHQADEWLPATVVGLDHAQTGFPLEGAHGKAACAACHDRGEPYSAADGASCVDCHADEDAHRNLLGDVCGDCHTPLAWERTRWRHDQSGWPLRGAHRLASCDDCHAVGYVGTPTDCGACHGAQAPASIPAHQSEYFAECELCHKPYTWASVYPH